jgi:hypothetical protein
MMEMIPYILDIWSIMFKIICTRPDVSYVFRITSRYQSNPGESHWKIVKNMCKYLRRIKNIFLVYVGDELVVHGYLDASFQ